MKNYSGAAGVILAAISLIAAPAIISRYVVNDESVVVEQPESQVTTLAAGDSAILYADVNSPEPRIWMEDAQGHKLFCCGVRQDGRVGFVMYKDGKPDKTAVTSPYSRRYPPVSSSSNKSL